MKTNSIDCIETKRKSAEKIYNIIKNMTPEEELIFWTNKNTNKNYTKR